MKEEIHNIVSGTLNEMTINKSRKMKRKKKKYFLNKLAKISKK